MELFPCFSVLNPMDENEQISDLASAFLEQQLPIPILPGEIAQRIRRVAPWMWTSRESWTSPYDLSAWLSEVLKHPTEDYVMIGHAGHGMNSYALHYYLVYGPLAVFAQFHWGGAYTDQSRTVLSLSRLYEAVESMLTGIAAAVREGRLPESARLIVKQSDFAGHGWRLLESPSESEDLESLQEAKDGLAAAQKAIPLS